MAWKGLTRIADIAEYLGVKPGRLQVARRQCRTGYIKKQLIDKKGKVRDLCYPVPHSALRAVQDAVKAKFLMDLELSPVICGYRKGMHNINSAQMIAGLRYVAKIDIKAFHPSIRPALVMKALVKLGVSHALSRVITQLVTHDGQVPQGAPTSNHIANVIVQHVLSQGVLDFCAAREVVLVNYGDDTAFGGNNRFAVDDCVRFATKVFKKNGLEANSKSSRAEHVGASRRFIGTSTAREKADLPRARYREYRKELRAAVFAERSPYSEVRANETTLRSFKSKLSYVKRLNPNKARTLRDDFYRLSQASRDNIRRRRVAILSLST